MILGVPETKNEKCFVIDFATTSNWSENNENYEEESDEERFHMN